MKKRLLLAGLVVLAGCESAVIPPEAGVAPYEYRLAVTPPLVLRWPAGSVIRVYVAGGDPTLGAALENGAAAWNRHALFGEYRLERTTDLGRADVVLRWSTEVGTVDYTGCFPSTPRAVTTFCAAGDDLRDGLWVFPRVDGGPSRVRMLVSVLATESASAGVLVAHELGHVLGIMRHSDDAQDLMYGQTLQVSSPSRRDVATVRALYQAEPQIVP